MAVIGALFTYDHSFKCHLMPILLAKDTYCDKTDSVEFLTLKTPLLNIKIPCFQSFMGNEK